MVGTANPFYGTQLWRVRDTQYAVNVSATEGGSASANVERAAKGDKVTDPAALVEPAEERLAEALLGVETPANAELAQRNYVTALKHLAQLREPIDAFFEGVMVMAEDARVRANRLALLKRIDDRFRSVADISLLAGG